MAAGFQPEVAELSFPSLSSLTRNIVVGTTLGLGIGIGIGTGLYISKKLTKTMTVDKDLVIGMQQLTNEMKELRCVLTRHNQENIIVPVKETRVTQNKYSANSLRDLLSINSDEDEEFYDFNQEDEVPASLQSGGQGMQSGGQDMQSGGQGMQSSPVDDIKSIIQEYEILNDEEHNDRDVNKVHQFLDNAAKKHPDSGEVLWRLGKSYYEVAAEQGKGGFLEEKKNLLYKGLAVAQRSVEVGSKIANAHKWYALLLGSTADYESTQDRILLGFKYKEHISKSIELNSKDPTAYHLLGRWCFEVSQLPWWQRRAAATFIAEPPTSTVDEALDNFLKAENLEPGFWLTNSYWIAKCYYEKSQYSECRQWLQKVINMDTKSPDDEKALQDARDLLQKV